jgi:Ca-activated chloride channel homolog
MKTRTLAVLTLALAGTSMLAACNTHGGPLATLPAEPRDEAAAKPVPPPPAPPPMPAAKLSTMEQRAAGVVAGAPAADALEGGLPEAESRDRFTDSDPNPVKRVAEAPVSTFSADVDTASYAWVRKALNDGVLPPAEAVRIEEMVNYFDYAYATPADRAAPFQPTIGVYTAPWNAERQIVHIGIQGLSLPEGERPPANLVFLLDVSGSMDDPEKLPLLKKSLAMLAGELTQQDRVSIVVYAGAAGTVLEPTPGNDTAKIVAALDNLSAGGSTAGGEGIRQAYALAKANRIEGGINRVILATDGDFNVGITDPGALEGYVARERESGVTLTVLGFGRGNYNDELMQKLAQAGNGNAAYIDTLNEARKTLVEEMQGTLFTIASDVKFQVEFNPACVSEYRQIGYETRQLKREDFNNDKVDAGDLGAGHRVTALYEITPVAAKGSVDPLRYGQEPAPAASCEGEYAYLKIRYKLPGETASRLIERPIAKADVFTSIESVPADMRFAASVAAFGQLLRGDPYLKSFGYDDVIALAQGARGADPFGYRAEFVQLARMAKTAAGLPAAKRDGGGISVN